MSARRYVPLILRDQRCRVECPDTCGSVSQRVRSLQQIGQPFTGFIPVPSQVPESSQPGRERQAHSDVILEGPGQRRTDVVVFGGQLVDRPLLLGSDQLRLVFDRQREYEFGVRAMDTLGFFSADQLFPRVLLQRHHEAIPGLAFLFFCQHQ